MGPGVWLPKFKDPKALSVLFTCYKPLNLLDMTVLLLKYLHFKYYLQNTVSTIFSETTYILERYSSGNVISFCNILVWDRESLKDKKATKW